MKRKNLSLSVVFDRAHRLTATGTGLVQIRATFAGQTRYFSTGVHVRPEQWDHRNRRVKEHALASEYNRRIYAYLDRLQEQEIELQKKYGFCRLDCLTLDDRSPSLSFSEFCQQELQRPGIADSTRRNQKSSLGILNTFREKIAFVDVDLPFIRAYDRFLYGRALMVNSVDKHHRVLRRYVNLAIQEGHLTPDQNPYRLFEMKTEEPERVFLTKEELRKIEELPLNRGQLALRNTRKLFLFSCYTGLRFGDVCRLYRGNVQETGEGLELRLRMHKTARQMVLPLYLLFPAVEGGPTRPERMILQAMKRAPSEAPFWPVTNQHLNRQLKHLASLAGIEKGLTYHCARRTFATYLAPHIPLHVLADLMGHRKITTTALYTRLTGQMVREELKRVNWNNG